MLALPLGSGCTEFRKQLPAQEVLAVLGMGLPSVSVCLEAIPCMGRPAHAAGAGAAFAALLLEATGTWLPLVESSMKFGLALPPNILSTVLQYFMQAVTEALHFSSCLKIPSQTAFMGNFWPLFAFGSFGSIG